MRSKTKGGALIAVALYALGHGTATPTAQEEVTSPGGALVARQILDENLTPRRTLEVYQQPERVWLLPMFWKTPERVGKVEPGEVVEVIGVKETYLWRDRLVWIQLQQANNEDPVWFRIGPQESASAALWRHWTRTDPTNEEETSESVNEEER
jgi:hypothetical protein